MSNTSPKLSIIAAMNHRRVIGINNTLPWSLPIDLRYFKKQTKNHAIIMGRKTYESIQRPLPMRHNIVITTQETWQQPGTHAVDSLERAITLAHTLSDQAKHFIIGGESIYQLALPLANEIHLTVVNNQTSGDRHFPCDLATLEQNGWQITSATDHPQDELHAYSFCIYQLEKTRS